jgi:anti-sigma B factor antagonist
VPSLDVSEVTEGRVRVLELSGELEISTLRSLQHQLIGAVEEHGCVVLDCMELTFIDSSGMRLLLGALRVVDRSNGCLIVACANPTVLRLFSVTGMDQTFEIVPTRDAAIDRAREHSAA